jgi:hypothetical protein
LMSVGQKAQQCQWCTLIPFVSIPCITLKLS